MQSTPPRPFIATQVAVPTAAPSGAMVPSAQGAVSQAVLARPERGDGAGFGMMETPGLHARGLAASKILARYVDLTAAGVTLAGAGVVVVLQPAAWPQLVLGAGLFLAARFLARDALVGGAARAAAAQEKILQLQEVAQQAADEANLATTVRERPDVTMVVLSDLKKEIVDKLTACSKTKIDWDRILDVCEDLLAELRDLGVSTEHSAYQKVLKFKADIELEIEKLTRAAMDLLEHGKGVPGWIEGQRIRQAELQAQKTHAERLAEAQKKVKDLVGEVETLTSTSRAVVDAVEQLTAEIKATAELFARVDALTEVGTWIALAERHGVSEETIKRLREQVAANPKALKTSGADI